MFCNLFGRNYKPTKCQFPLSNTFSRLCFISLTWKKVVHAQSHLIGKIKRCTWPVCRGCL
jgi:hypothetical protein